MKNALEQEIGEAAKSANQFSAYFSPGGTKVFSMIDSLGASTDMAALEIMAKVSEEERQCTVTLKADLDALKSSNPELQIKAITELKRQVEALGKAAGVLADFNSEEYSDLLTKVQTAKERFEEASKNSFGGLAIPGVLQEEWERFIVAGEEYVRTLRSRDSYPVANSSCVYCQQPLEQSAVDLIRKYREFCNNNYRSDLDKSQKELVAQTTPVTGLDFGKLTAELVAVLEANKQLSKEEQVLLNAVVTGGQATATAIAEGRDHSWADRKSEAIQARNQLKTILEQCQTGLKDLTTRKDERETLLRDKEGGLAELEARIKLSQILPAVREFVERAKWIDRA